MTNRDVRFAVTTTDGTLSFSHAQDGYSVHDGAVWIYVFGDGDPYLQILPLTRVVLIEDFRDPPDWPIRG